ncbi:hypothetical protein N7478_005464 [Penicillium angulare]|uniref:uncharacterized protein n=1 Tax=Penicillium angulare TaxID=116970 RepID=UPI002541C76D|nr:uncharacterized protein N7478_005464 [Penicillium angulare]KAJ5280092.1 hypothetical protein N7478_005464 [Penicillium angulare]
MPPDRGRASRACTSCRKQKTRCYEPGVPGKACLRCERLHQKCSLVQESEQQEDEESPPHSGTDARLERLERTVATLLDRLGEGPAGFDDHESNRPSALTTPETGEVTYEETESPAPPIMVLRNLAADSGVKSTPDTKGTAAVVDDLIPQDLALALVTM